MDQLFEWCYFHFICEEMKASLVLHQTDVFGLAHDPYMSISLVMRNALPAYDRRRLAVGPTFESRALLLPIIAAETEHGIYIDAEFDSCHLQGNLRRNGLPVEINKGRLICDGLGNQSIWRVHVPAGTFSGTISVRGGKAVAVNAIAYCDHQYGSLPAQDFVRSWVWGVVSDGTIAYGFFRIITQANEVIDRAFCSMPGRTDTFTCIDENYLSDLRDRIDPAAFTGDATVAFGEHALNFSISPSTLIRQRISEDHGDFVFDYCRWHCKDMRGFLGFTEYMHFTR